MADAGSSVTLIFYRMQDKWYREPLLNIVAAACQMSNLTHVEIGIGEHAGQGGQIANVCRVFNDAVGVEIVERTGRNPQYEYIQLGCSKNAERRMLHYAKTRCLGKPFSQVGMARSILWPRQTDDTSFFCAELVAAILKAGGLMEQSSNPGSATPEILYKLYKERGSLSGNPYVLRDMQQACGAGLQFSSIGQHVNGHAQLYGPPSSRAKTPQEQQAEEREALLTRQAVMAPMAHHQHPLHASPCASCATCAPRSVSSTGAFRQIGGGGVAPARGASAAPSAGPRTAVGLTFNGLTMNSAAGHRRA